MSSPSQGRGSCGHMMAVSTPIRNVLGVGTRASGMTLVLNRSCAVFVILLLLLSMICSSPLSIKYVGRKKRVY